MAGGGSGGVMTSARSCGAACSLLAVALGGGCSREPPAPSASSSADPSGARAAGSATASANPAGRFQVGWDPQTGRGTVTQRYDDGATIRLCLQCGYPGYTGGLVIGSYSGSGFEYLPAQPQRGFRSINVFCAQDESIWDRASGREYAFGWSENFGSGPDGERLEFVSGRVRERGPTQVVLTSRNQGGCYRVDKRLLWAAEARHVLIATWIRNTCEQPVRFDFWSGDDPWLGKYRSSEGDIGYTNEALVRTETAIDPARFHYGGVYDLGNTAGGEQEGGFSGAANFIMPAPTTAKPDRIYVANRFAHSDDDISPGAPLDNRTMLAFNLGWLDLRLAPAEQLGFTYALGLACSTGRAELPEPPAIPTAQWSAVEQRSELRFVREWIELRLTPEHLEVTGRYELANAGASPRRLGIHYPFPSDAAHSAPDFVELDGKRLKRFAPEGARFPLELPARGTKTFRVRYRQRHSTKRATYIVTSAKRWGQPLERAEFVIRYPRTFRNVQLSYEADSTRQVGSETEVRFVRAPFSPEKDVVIRWE